MKPITRYQEQITLLKDRGLTMPDEDRVTHYLKHIGYYRLSGYFKHFQTESDEFLDNTEFETVLTTYVFDRKIRILLLDALERIEISFKAQICDIMCFRTSDDLWYKNKENFAQDKADTAFTVLTKTIESAVQNSKEAWIGKAIKQKQDLSKLPIWMICNILTFGQVSFVFSNLASKHQKLIAKKYGVNGKVLRTSMRSLSAIRNICAHHNRLWNRTIDTPFFVPNSLKKYELDPSKLFFSLIITSIFLQKISPRTEWPTQMKCLLVEYSSVEREAMGFPNNWEQVFDEAIKK